MPRVFHRSSRIRKTRRAPPADCLSECVFAPGMKATRQDHARPDCGNPTALDRCSYCGIAGILTCRDERHTGLTKPPDQQRSSNISNPPYSILIRNESALSASAAASFSALRASSFASSIALKCAAKSRRTSLKLHFSRLRAPMLLETLG